MSSPRDAALILGGWSMVQGAKSIRGAGFAAIASLFAVAAVGAASAASADAFFTITPCRVFDTRAADSPAMQGGVSRFIPIIGVGSCGIPAEATAISVNITVTNATAGGDMNVGAGDAVLPPAAAARPSFQPTKPRRNNGIRQLATDGVACVA